MASSKQQIHSGAGGGDNTTGEKNQPPFPEWSDSFVNSTLWGKPLNKLGATAKLSSPYEEIDELYEDPAGLQDMPESIEVHSWLRPHQLEGPWKLQPDSTFQDIFNINKHLMTYNIMRMIVSSVLCVEREAYHRPFPIEHQSDQFCAPAKSLLWKPWYHVYSQSPAGKDKPHSMQMNPYGKYIVRLFYLGKWRRILVDDRLPVGETGQLLLPVSSACNLWLPLLSKALLRIASLSWTVNDSCVDFSVVHCLTGWIPTSFATKGCTELQLWCVCTQLLESTEQVTQAPGCCLAKICPDESFTDLPATKSRAIFAVAFNPIAIRSRKSKSISTSSFENLLLVSNVRYNSALPDPLWKEYRWKQWAFDKGMIPDMYSKPMRNIQVFNPLTKPTLSHVTDEDDWVDFKIFISFVRYLEVYYKPSYFKYSLKSWTISEFLKKPNITEDVVRGRNSSRGKGDKKDRSSKSTKSRSISPLPPKKEKSFTKGKSSRGSREKKVKKGLKVNETQLSFDDWTAQIDQKPSFFYLLIDSMVCKQLYVCLSAYDSSPPTYAHLFVGKFIWHSSSVAPIVFMLSTSATKGIMLTLSPGLHVYRIWHCLPTHFCLQIYSNTQFSTGSKINIQQILTSDSLSFQYYGNDISEKFNALLDTGAGGEDHGQSYDRLMGALHPPQLNVQLTWPDYHIAHKQIEMAFEESLIEMLTDTAKSLEEFQLTLEAFQLLFLSPKFGEMTLKNIKSDYYIYIQDCRRSLLEKEALLNLNFKEDGIVQTGTKKEKKSPKSGKRKSPSPSHKTSIKSPKTSIKSGKLSTKSGKKGKRVDTKSNKPSIKKIEMRKIIQCKERNLLINDPNKSIILIKKIISKVPHLRQFYPFGHEEDYRLFYQDYSGEIKVSDNWVVVIRCVLNLHTTYEVPCSLHIWSPIKNIILRLIDNDSNCDVPFGFVENQVSFLSQNLTGYTLCVYGWSPAQVEPWRLRVMGMSKESLLHVCDSGGCSPDTVTQLPDQSQQSVQGYYVPNKARLIARCHLEVYADVTVLLRLYLSHPTAMCQFTVRDPVGNIVHGATGMGHIIIPILHLLGAKSETISSSEKQKGIIYVIEVKLLKETWTLSSEEIKSMLYYKERLPDIYYKYKADKFSMSQETIQSDDEPELQCFENKIKPSWIVTVASDLQKEESVKLRQDLSVFEALEELRHKWDQENVNITDCLEIRQQFLHQLNEDKDAHSEEDVFHLTAKRTGQLMKEYGSNGFLKSSPSEQLSALSFFAQSEYPSAASSRSHSGIYNDVDETLPGSIPLSNSPCQFKFSADNHTSMSLEKSAEIENVKPNNCNMLVRQTGTHKALEDLRQKKIVNLKETYEETSALRLQVLNSVKIGNVASGKESKKGTKSLAPSPVKSLPNSLVTAKSKKKK